MRTVSKSTCLSKLSSARWAYLLLKHAAWKKGLCTAIAGKQLCFSITQKSLEQLQVDYAVGVNHDNIVQLLDVFVEGEQYVIVVRHLAHAFKCTGFPATSSC